jgi:hypothetical protein
MIPEEDSSIKKLDAKINVLNSNQFAPLASISSDEMNIVLDF